MDIALYVVTTFVLCFTGTVLQASTGFGMALISMAILPLVLPLDLTLIIIMWIGGYTAAVIFIKIRKHFDFKLIRVPLFVMICARFIGIWLVSGFLDIKLIEIILGITLLILSVYLLFLVKSSI